MLNPHHSAGRHPENELTVAEPPEHCPSTWDDPRGPQSSQLSTLGVRRPQSSRKAHNLAHVPIDNLVLVIGAGASRNLNSSQDPMPLMHDWNETLRKALDAQGSSLSGIIGIHHGQDGPDFEKAIGDFLTWQRSIDLSARYLPLGLEIPGQYDLDDWRRRSGWRAQIIIATLTRTLYEQFGEERISTVGAKTAYRALFESFDFRAGATITIATTNYDPAIELALAEMNMKPSTGAVPGPGGSTVLEPVSRRAIRSSAWRSRSPSSRKGWLVHTG
jgi:hypothetical protein